MSSLERVPPSSVEAEMCVLGSILRDNEVMAEVREILPKPEAFYRESHRDIYRILLSRWEESAPTDLSLLHQKLLDVGKLEEVGGDAYLAEVFEAPATSANAAYYAADVARCYRRRQVILACADATMESYDGSYEPDETLAKLERSLADSAGTDGQDMGGLDAALAEAFDGLPDPDGTDASAGLGTGFRTLDAKTGGMHAQDVIVLAGCTSAGKTALAIQIAEYVSRSHPVTYFSLEMSRLQLAQRMGALMAGVPAINWRRGGWTPEQRERLGTAVEEIRGRPIIVVDRPMVRPEDVRALTHLSTPRDQQALVVIDYLQLLAASQGRNQTREQVVSQMSRSMKGLARDTGHTVLVLSQFNREVDRRDDRRPRLSDLRESGAIEQDADIVLLLHRPESKMGKECEMLVGKNRHGPTATLDFWKNSGSDRAALWLGFEWSCMRFREANDVPF